MVWLDLRKRHGIATGWVLCSLIGCGPLISSEDAGSDGNTGSTGSSSNGESADPTQSSPPNPTVATTSPMPTSTTGSPTTSTTEVPPDSSPPNPTTTSTDESSSGTGGVDFLIKSDEFGDTPIECSIWEHDCPRGEKCMPWANDGGNVWNATRCSPIDPNPDGPGESCMAEDSGVSGVDTCDGTSMCFGVDESLNGYCTPFCLGSPESPTCADPTRSCTLGGDSVLALCLPACDPLEQDCPAGQGCYEFSNGFQCAPDASNEGGDDGDTCGFINDCSPGLICLQSTQTADCEDNTGCCSPYCDITEPNTCLGEGEECVAFYAQGKAPPGLDNVGICALP